MDIKGLFKTTKMNAALTSYFVKDDDILYLNDIDEICGLGVRCEISHAHERFYLKIYSSKLYNNVEEDFVRFYIINEPIVREGQNYREKALKKLIEKFNEKVPSLWFDKLSGHIKDEPKKTFDLEKEIVALIKPHKNIKIRDDNVCCVCHEKTYCKTECKHYLCYECAGKIEYTDDDECFGDDKLPCPLCRQNISFVNV